MEVEARTATGRVTIVALDLNRRKLQNLRRALMQSKNILPRKNKLLSKVRELHEMNPMLGLRGVRLSIVFPGIVEMQTAAIVGAAAQVKKEGIDVNPDMIPLIGYAGDLERVAKETAAAEGVAVDYKFGTMIEIPRACLTAGEIAKEAEFFSFGTNEGRR